MRIITVIIIYSPILWFWPTRISAPTDYRNIYRTVSVVSRNNKANMRCQGNNNNNNKARGSQTNTRVALQLYNFKVRIKSNWKVACVLRNRYLASSRVGSEWNKCRSKKERTKLSRAEGERETELCWSALLLCSVPLFVSSLFLVLELSRPKLHFCYRYCFCFCTS